MIDRRLQDLMKSCYKVITELSSKLPDNGEKIRIRLEILEEEYQRREQARAQKVGFAS